MSLAFALEHVVVAREVKAPARDLDQRLVRARPVVDDQPDEVAEGELEVRERVVDHGARLAQPPARAGHRLVARRLVLRLAEARERAATGRGAVGSPRVNRARCI